MIADPTPYPMGLRELESRLTHSNVGHMSRATNSAPIVMAAVYDDSSHIFDSGLEKRTVSCAWSGKFLRRSVVGVRKMARVVNERHGEPAGATPGYESKKFSPPSIPVFVSAARRSSQSSSVNERYGDPVATFSFLFKV